MKKYTAETSLNKSSSELITTHVMLQILWNSTVLHQGPAEEQELRRVFRTTFCFDFFKFHFALKKNTTYSRT